MRSSPTDLAKNIQLKVPTEDLFGSNVSVAEIFAAKKSMMQHLLRNTYTKCL